VFQDDRLAGLVCQYGRAIIKIESHSSLMKESFYTAFRAFTGTIGLLLLAILNVNAQPKLISSGAGETLPAIGHVIPDVELCDSMGQLRSLSSLRG
jgi:hypothetical protein